MRNIARIGLAIAFVMALIRARDYQRPQPNPALRVDRQATSPRLEIQ
jgi:hypothetical protein